MLKQKEQLLDLIDHPDAELACNVYMLLGGFREFATELFSKFVKKYYQESLYEKSNAILEALRQLTLATDDNLSFFRRVIQEENRIELRAVAAMALIETQKQAVDAITMNVLWDFVKYRVDHEEKIEEMPSWKFVHDETTSIRAISRILIELSSPPNVTTFNTFVTLLKDPDRVFEFVQDLFFYLYQDDRYKGVVGLHSSRDGRTVTKYCRRGLIEVELIDPMDPIREEFISILQMVVALPLFWEVESNLLNVFGLPHAKDDIAKLIEKFHMNAKIT